MTSALARSYAAAQASPRYALALIAVGAALLAKDLLPGGSDAPFLLLGAAVVLASYFGGRGPGFVATLAGAFAVHLLYLAPSAPLALDDQSRAWLAAFGLEGVVITLATDTLRRTRAEARAMASREHIAREAAEAALQVRDTFLSVASHELRTPLTTMRAATQLALRRAQQVNGAEDVVGLLHQTLRATRRLERIMQNVLDLSQLQRGGLVLHLEEFDLGALVREVTDGIRVTLPKDRRIDVIGPDSVVVRGDPVRIEQAITNLIDNALKYSPETKNVEIRLQRDLHALSVSVRDHGVGIAAAARERIFEPYHRERPGDVRGMGLGLSVVREVVRLHGGDVTVRTPTDGGSIFELILPASP